MNCNFLAKKIIAWFNVNQNAEKQKDFAFRFRRKESYNYLQNFPLLILSVIRRHGPRHRILIGWEAHFQCLRRPHHGWGRQANKILRNFNLLDWLKQASFQESS